MNLNKTVGFEYLIKDQIKNAVLECCCEILPHKIMLDNPERVFYNGIVWKPDFKVKSIQL